MIEVDVNRSALSRRLRGPTPLRDPELQNRIDQRAAIAHWHRHEVFAENQVGLLRMLREQTSLHSANPSSELCQMF